MSTVQAAGSASPAAQILASTSQESARPKIETAPPTTAERAPMCSKPIVPDASDHAIVSVSFTRKFRFVTVSKSASARSAESAPGRRRTSSMSP